MPFGLLSAGATLQRLLDQVICAEREPKVFAYLNDLKVVFKTFEKNWSILHLLFDRPRGAELKVDPENGHFYKR